MSDRLRRLIDRLEPRLRRVVYAALKDLPPGSVGLLTDALEAGDVDGALRIVARDLQAASAEIRRLLLEAIGTGKTVTSASYGLSFDLTDPLVVAAAERHAGQLITAVTEETIRAVRGVIVEGIREGVPPREQARQIMRLVGLTERDAGAVDRFWRGMLEAGTRQEQADARAQRYADRLLRRRAENIARTEIIRASTEGTRQGWEAAADAGLLDPRTASVIWIVTPDDRLCPRCSALGGTTVGFVDKFTATVEATGDLSRNPGGTARWTGPTRPLKEYITVEGPPLHVACRCALGLVLA